MLRLAHHVPLVTRKIPLKSKVRRRLVRAIADLHPDVEIVRVRAWARSDPEAGERWVADQRSLGRGTHDAYLVVIKRQPGADPPPGDS